MNTWHISRRSLLTRWYLWVWEADESSINLCKFFWGIVLSPFAVALRVTMYPLIRIFEWWDKRQLKKREDLAKKWVEDPNYEPPPSFLSKLLEKLANLFVKIGMFFSGQWGWFKYVWYTLVIGFWLAVVGSFIALFVIHPIPMLVTTGGVLLGFSLIIGLVALIEKRAEKKTRTPGPFKTMFEGAKAAKNRTCPQIKVVE